MWSNKSDTDLKDEGSPDDVRDDEAEREPDGDGLAGVVVGLVLGGRGVLVQRVAVGGRVLVLRLQPVVLGHAVQAHAAGGRQLAHGNAFKGNES